MVYKGFFQNIKGPPMAMNYSEVNESTEDSCLLIGFSRGFILA